MVMQGRFLLAGHRLVRVNVRALLHLPARQGHRDSELVTIRFPQGARRDQHFASRQPMACVHHQVTDDPRVVVEVEIMHLSNITIGGDNGVPKQDFQAA